MKQGAVGGSAVRLLAVVIGISAASARADGNEVHGAVDGRVLTDAGDRIGGLMTADLWLGRGRFRYGGAAGVGALSKGRAADITLFPDHAEDASSRVFTPLMLSLAFVPLEDHSGLTLALRGGGYAGAQKGGFTSGAALSAAIGYRFALGESASVRLGGDAWALFGGHGGLFVGPYVGLGF